MAGKKIKYEYTKREKLMVKYYLLFGSKVEAYKFAHQKYDEDNYSHTSYASRLFQSEKIKMLLYSESKSIKEKIPKIMERVGMNNTELNNNNLSKLKNVDSIDKDTAITIIENIINKNPNDKAIIKDLIPKLSELKDWKKETIQTKSNVVLFELPNKKK